MGVSKLPALQEIMDEFTTSGTWVCPGGVVSAEFLVVGAGGGGGGAYCNLVTNAVGGGGGGGGAVKKVKLRVTPGSTYTITIGAKGTGGTNTAGANGGFSEVILSGTTLIRSLGGLGGDGINTTPAIVAASEITAAGGAGGGTGASDTDSSACTGGGGGAAVAGIVTTATIFNPGAGEGSLGKNATTSPDGITNIRGQMGIDGFGAGGNGANWNNGGSAIAYDPNYGAGAGGVRTSAGASNGSNATIAGCGGGGACSILSAATGSTGGNGADGLVRITYLA